MVSLRELQKALLTYLDCKHDAHIEGLFSVFAASQAERERSLRKGLKELLEDFGDLEDYDNDNVIELVNGLKGLLAKEAFVGSKP